MSFEFMILPAAPSMSATVMSITSYCMQNVSGSEWKGGKTDVASFLFVGEGSDKFLDSRNEDLSSGRDEFRKKGEEIGHRFVNGTTE